jgi:hypothetical protein
VVVWLEVVAVVVQEESLVNNRLVVLPLVPEASGVRKKLMAMTEAKMMTAGIPP